MSGRSVPFAPRARIVVGYKASSTRRSDSKPPEPRVTILYDSGLIWVSVNRWKSGTPVQLYVTSGMPITHCSLATSETMGKESSSARVKFKGLFIKPYILTMSAAWNAPTKSDVGSKLIKAPPRSNIKNAESELLKNHL